MAADHVVGIFREYDNSCSLLAINWDGTNTTLATNLRSCSNATNLYPAYSALNGATQKLAVAIQSAAYVFEYDTRTGAESVGAPLPTNASDAFIGFVAVGPTEYLVTMNNIYAIKAGVISHYAFVSLPADGQVAGTATGGTNGAGRLFVASTTDASLYTVDLGANGAVSTLQAGVSRDWDLQWSDATQSLIELAAYQLYSTSADTGKSTKVMDIPDGPGYPRVNGISPDGATFWFMDFSYIYTIDIDKAAVVTKGNFTWAPRCVGYPQWVSL